MFEKVLDSSENEALDAKGSELVCCVCMDTIKNGNKVVELKC